MKLLDEWKLLLKRAWSVRLAVLAGFLSGVEIVLPLFQPEFPRGIFAGLSILASTAAMVARIVAQPRMRDE